MTEVFSVTQYILKCLSVVSLLHMIGYKNSQGKITFILGKREQFTEGFCTFRFFSEELKYTVLP